MGDILQKLFGGSSQQSQSNSHNQAYGTLSSALAPYLSGGGSNYNMLTNALNGGQGSQDAFNNYLNSTGYKAQMQAGDQAITGSAAAKGILNSGSAAKALTTFGQNLAQTGYNNYLSQLGNASQLGLQAGGVLSGAGQVSNSQSSGSSSTGGLGSSLGSLAGLFLGI